MEVSIQFVRRWITCDRGLNRVKRLWVSIFHVILVSAMLVTVMSGCLGEGALPLQRSYEFREQIPAGMPRDEAVAILSEDAWYHEICEDHTFNAELFFFDNREWARSEIVVLESEWIDDVLVVEGIYGAEPNEWHTWYEGCYDRSMFTEKKDSPLATP